MTRRLPSHVLAERIIARGSDHSALLGAVQSFGARRTVEALACLHRDHHPVATSMYACSPHASARDDLFGTLAQGGATLAELMTAAIALSPNPAAAGYACQDALRVFMGAAAQNIRKAHGDIVAAGMSLEVKCTGLDLDRYGSQALTINGVRPTDSVKAFLVLTYAGIDTHPRTWLISKEHMLRELARFGSTSNGRPLSATRLGDKHTIKRLRLTNEVVTNFDSRYGFADPSAMLRGAIDDTLVAQLHRLAYADVAAAG
jgi:hypothetical protein